MLLQKMVQESRFDPKKNYLKEALFESIRDVSKESIPKFIDKGFRFLRDEADRIREANVVLNQDQPMG